MEKVVVITGASAGIGAALAKELGAKKHHLVLAARREKELRAVCDATGTRAIAVVADVTRRADVEKIRDRAIAEFGRVDVWINNAGVGIMRTVLETTDDDVDAMISMNLKSALYGMQAIVPHFKSRGEGHLINVSSFLARVPMASVRAMYSASKAALNSLTANLRMDLATTFPKIHVSTVMPGIVSTAFAKNVIGAAPVAGPPPGAAAGNPFKPQTAEEVAAAIATLIEAPRAELFTNPEQAEAASRYMADVAAFEARIAGHARK